MAWLVPALAGKTTPRSLHSANAPYSCYTPHGSRPPHPSPFLRTTGTTGCTAVARSAFAHCVPNRRSATAAISTAALVQSMGAPRRSTASETSATSLSESHPLSCGSVVADDLLVRASPGKCSSTFLLAGHRRRAFARLLGL